MKTKEPDLCPGITRNPQVTLMETPLKRKTQNPLFAFEEHCPLNARHQIKKRPK